MSAVQRLGDVMVHESSVSGTIERDPDRGCGHGANVPRRVCTTSSSVDHQVAHHLMAAGVARSAGRAVPSARVPLRRSLGRLAIVIGPLAVVEWVAYPLLLHDQATWWLSYIAYLALGVILPGTLVAQAFVRWRADWLTWIGMGWALGHVLEVVSIEAAKLVGVPRLFLLWIPIAYLLVWRKQRWQAEITAVTHPVRCAVLLAVVVAFASTTFTALNLLELSPQPTYQSDV